MATADIEYGDVVAELTKIREACTDLFSISDMVDAFTFDREDGSRTWGGKLSYTEAFGFLINRPSATAGAYVTEQQLRMHRAVSRAFCILNPYWKSVRENKINYAIGTGHVWSIVPRRKGKTVEQELAWKVQSELEQFCKVNNYRRRQGEKLTRLDRDGEYFLRYLTNKPDEILRVRFVEPLLVQDPPGKGPHTGTWFGVQFDGTDYEEPIGYYVRPTSYDGGTTEDMMEQWRSLVPAEEMQHVTANVDIGSPRGLPTTYDLQDSLIQACSTLKSMGKLVDIRARIAVIVKQVNATLGQIQPLLLKNRIGTAQGSSGPSMNVFKYPYGSILNTNDQRTYEFPSQNIETDKIVHSLKADLQSVAAAMGLADFTISGDSSAAFANALVKEGPMDRAIGRIQQDLIEKDTEVYERALAFAAEHGRLPEDVLETVRVDIMPPGVIARDRLVNTQADEILVRNNAMSPDTMAMRSNLDPEDEREKIKVNPSPEQAAAKMAMENPGAMGNGNTRSNQPSLKAGSNARGVPAGKEPGPSANPSAKSREGVEESSHEPHSQDMPTTAELAMASVWLTPGWMEQTRQEVMSLPVAATPPRDSGMRAEYEPGVQGVRLGVVDGQTVWAVDADAIMIKHDAQDFVVAGNHMRWAWIPESVILVDWSYPPAEMAHDLYHEAIETRCMALGKFSYALGHKIANFYERQLMLQLRPELQSLVPA